MKKHLTRVQVIHQLTTGLKFCPSCSVNKPLADFREHDRSKDGMRYKCRACEAKNLRLSRLRRGIVKKKPSIKNSLSLRDFHLRRNYGISEAELIRILKLQDNKCGICSVEVTIQSCCLDHCHTTEKVRGALCRKCNTGLGMFRDNLHLLYKAIIYLIRKDKLSVIN